MGHRQRILATLTGEGAADATAVAPDLSAWLTIFPHNLDVVMISPN